MGDMIANKKVYAIVVSYNAARWIRPCLESLQRSEHPVVPIVVDNDSSDDTVTIIRDDFRDVILIQQDRNLGFGKANNVGLRYARERGFDYILLLNQDAVIFQDTVGKMIEIFEKNENYGILSPVHLNGDGGFEGAFEKYLTQSMEENHFLEDVIIGARMAEVYEARFINAAIWFLNKRCIETVGIFNPIFNHYGEDSEYCRRCIFHTIRIGFCPHLFGIHYRSQKKRNFFELNQNPQNLRFVNVSLVMLSNINVNFVKSYFMFGAYSMVHVIKNLFSFKWKNFWSILRGFLYIQRIIPQIMRNREKSRQGKAFIY